MFIHYFSVVLIVMGNCFFYGDYPFWIRFAGALIAGIGYPIFISRLQNLYDRLETLERKLK